MASPSEPSWSSLRRTLSVAFLHSVRGETLPELANRQPSQEYGQMLPNRLLRFIVKEQLGRIARMTASLSSHVDSKASALALVSLVHGLLSRAHAGTLFVRSIARAKGTYAVGGGHRRYTLMKSLIGHFVLAIC